MAFALFLVFSLCFHAALGGLLCEHLPDEYCSFSVSTLGNRCLLEKYLTREGKMKYQCKTSQVVVDGGVLMREIIETDDCINACGLDRYTVGISSDSLQDGHFTSKLCSANCYQNCPNIVDLYSNLYLAEGAYLPVVCQKQKSGHANGAIAGLRSLVVEPKYVAAPSPDSGHVHVESIAPSSSSMA